MDVLRRCLPYMIEPEKRRRAVMITEVWPTLVVRNGKYSATQLAKMDEFEVEFFKNSRKIN